MIYNKNSSIIILIYIIKLGKNLKIYINIKKDKSLKNNYINYYFYAFVKKVKKRKEWLKIWKTKKEEKNTKES